MCGQLAEHFRIRCAFLNQMESAGLHKVIDDPSANNTVETHYKYRGDQAYYSYYVPF